MLPTFISLFSIFGLLTLLSATCYGAYHLLKHENQAVKVPVRVQQDPQHRK